VVDVAPAYRLEEIEVSVGCAGADKRLEEVRGDAVVVAIRRADGSSLFQPAGETVLRSGDVLVAVGRLDTLQRLDDLFQPVAAPAS
jgi:Trk K+ transport system NAD-binding subunit